MPIFAFTGLAASGREPFSATGRRWMFPLLGPAVHHLRDGQSGPDKAPDSPTRKRSTGCDVDADGKYRYNPSFFKNTCLNPSKSMQNSVDLRPFVFRIDPKYVPNPLFAFTGLADSGRDPFPATLRGRRFTRPGPAVPHHLRGQSGHYAAPDCLIPELGIPPKTKKCQPKN